MNLMVEEFLETEGAAGECDEGCFKKHGEKIGCQAGSQPPPAQHQTRHSLSAQELFRKRSVRESLEWRLHGMHRSYYSLEPIEVDEL